MRTSPAHRLLAAFMALWLPFCCCQARAAARTVVHAVHGGDASAACRDDGPPPCCRAAQEPAGDRCEDGRGAERSPEAPAPCGDCVACGALKDKAAAPEVPAIEHDSVGVADSALTAVPEHDVPSARAGAASWPRANAPPWKPGGRTALALHATLVI